MGSKVINQTIERELIYKLTNLPPDSGLIYGILSNALLASLEQGAGLINEEKDARAAMACAVNMEAHQFDGGKDDPSEQAEAVLLAVKSGFEAVNESYNARHHDGNISKTAEAAVIACYDAAVQCAELTKDRVNSHFGFGRAVSALNCCLNAMLIETRFSERHKNIVIETAYNQSVEVPHKEPVLAILLNAAILSAFVHSNWVVDKYSKQGGLKKAIDSTAEIINGFGISTKESNVIDDLTKAVELAESADSDYLATKKKANREKAGVNALYGSMEAMLLMSELYSYFIDTYTDDRPDIVDDAADAVGHLMDAVLTSVWMITNNKIKGTMADKQIAASTDITDTIIAVIGNNLESWTTQARTIGHERG